MKNKHRHLLLETGIILAVSFFIALLINFISPNGISTVGQWDTEKGVITANPRDKTKEGPEEIDHISQVIPIYNSKEALFVDARDRNSYRNGHIKGAVSLPIRDYDNAILSFFETYDSTQKIVTYCSGRECEDSHFLAENLYSDGYTNISVFIDGFEVWEKNGMPIASDER